VKRKAFQTVAALTLLAVLVMALPPLALAEGSEPDPLRNPVVNFRGVIESQDEQTWVVSGVTVVLDERTVVLDQAGPAVEGATVQVLGTRQQDGSVLARVIKVLKPAVSPPRPVQFTAPIRDLPDEGLIGEWVIGEETVVVSDQTKILPDGVVPALGDIAHVAGFRTNDGKVDARMIQIRAPSAVEVEFVGPIQRFSDTEWVVRDVTVVIVESTVIEGTPEVGLLAEVKGFLQPDRTVMASHIRVREPAATVNIRGIIVSKSNDGLPAVWGIRPLVTTDVYPSVISVTVTANTIIDEEKGPADIGALVQVKAVPLSTAASVNGDVTLVARLIKVLRPPVNQEITFAGRIEEIHEDFWIVRGIRVLILDTTVIDGLEPAVGLTAVVTGILRTDRVVEASHIAVREALPDIWEFDGVIREKSETIPGEWVIAPDGTLPVLLTVWVTPWTVIQGPAEVGAHVHVVVLRSASGHLIALKISVLRNETD